LPISVPPVVRNALRLLADADLLAEHGRHASAFVLATLAFEEVGKVVLLFWGRSSEIAQATRGTSAHVQKQAAAASLLMADLTHLTAHDHAKSVGLASPKALTENDVPSAVEAIARALSGSAEARLFDLAAAGVLDMTKQSGLYVDEWFSEHDLTHFGFSQEDSERARADARRVLSLLRDVEKLSLARVLFLTDPVKERIAASRAAKAALRSSAGRSEAG
jgi:AbiV family abortive infection protein